MTSDVEKIVTDALARDYERLEREDVRLFVEGDGSPKPYGVISASEAAQSLDEFEATATWFGKRVADMDRRELLEAFRILAENERRATAQYHAEAKSHARTLIAFAKRA